MKYMFYLAAILFSLNASSQSYNQDKIALTNFITRMYNQEPWMGVKVFLDYESKYLLSVVKLKTSNYSSESSMVRVAEVKSRAQSNQFLNGSYISAESVIKSTRIGKNNSDSVDEITDVLKELSFGFVETMELVTNFSPESDKDYKVFVYMKLLQKNLEKTK
jgi:hypothetical protein